jgi:hypothetical protein
MSAFVFGLLFGMATVLPVGVQSFVVLNQGLTVGYPRVFFGIVTASCCDTLLIVLGAVGVSAILNAPGSREALILVGVGFLLVMGDDKAADPRTAGGVEQIPRPLPTHEVVGGVVLLEFARVQALGQFGELVDHRVRFGPSHYRPQPSGVEDVAHYCFGAKVTEQAEFLLRPGYRGHLVTRLDQLRHQSPADGASCTCHKDSHG